MLKINLSKDTVKFLKKLPAKQAKQIAKKIMELRENPFLNDTKKLQGVPYLRADSGEFRIIYFVKQETLHVVLVGKRNDGEVYKKMLRKI